MRVITMLLILIAYSALCYLIVIGVLTGLFMLQQAVPGWVIATVFCALAFLVVRGVLNLIRFSGEDT